MTILFEENLYRHIQLRIEIERVLVDKITSRGQRAFIFESKMHGRMFCLDDVIQCAESDEFYYHEVMAHVPMTSLANPRRIAIVGGASGAMAREVLKHSSCRSIEMVEIDQENIELCKAYMPAVHANCFDDKRLQVKIADAYNWISEIEEKFDLIIVDSPDPIGHAEKLFSKDFYRKCQAALTTTGVLVCQAGVPFFQGESFKGVLSDISSMFLHAGSFQSSIPFFIGGNMNFVWGSNITDLNTCLNDDWHSRAHQISQKTRHYSPQVHRSALIHDLAVGRSKQTRRDSAPIQCKENLSAI